MLFHFLYSIKKPEKEANFNDLSLWGTTADTVRSPIAAENYKASCDFFRKSVWYEKPSIAVVNARFMACGGKYVKSTGNSCLPTPADGGSDKQKWGFEMGRTEKRENVVSGLRERDLPAIPRDRPAAGGQGESDAQGGEMRIYAPAKGWMRRLRVSCCAAVFMGLPLGLGLGVGLPLSGVSEPEVALIAAAACILAGPLTLLLWLRSVQALWADTWVYVRTGQTLWRVDLSRLNGIDTCRYTTKNGSLRTLRWERLTPEEQERAKAAISRGISLLSGGELISGGMLRRTLIPMTELRVEKDTKWYWLVSCPTERGRRKKWTVAKAYPGFTPAPGLEMPQGPVPFRWAPLGVALMAAVAAIVIVFAAAAALNGAADYGFPLPGASDSRPENTNSYEYHGVTYRVDSAFEEIGENVFFDAKTAAFYYLTVETGMDEDAALSTLTELIGDHRMDPAFDRFQFSYLDEPSILVPLTAADGAIYQHTILSLYFTGEAGEMVIHSGIVLSEDGVLVTAGATHVDSGDVETVKTGIVHILQSVVRSDAAADRGFDG